MFVVVDHKWCFQSFYWCCRFFCRGGQL